MHIIQTPAHLTELFESLALAPKEKKALARELANDVRKFFRGQISQEKDIFGKPYIPRQNQRVTFDKKGKRKVNRNMFSGLSRALDRNFDENSFEVGLHGRFGEIGDIHNAGSDVEVPLRYRAEGSSKANYYKMPKRVFIGWTKDLEAQIAHKILSNMRPTA